MATERQEKHHWKEALPGDYLGAWSLNGDDRILTIKNAGREIVTGANGKKEELLVIHWQENELPMVCNRTNAKTIAKLYSPYLEDWRGKKIQLFPTTTRFGGEIVECLRIRPTAPKPAAAIRCEGCGETIRAAANMTAQQLAEYTRAKYGKALCSECATKARTAQSEAKKQTEAQKEAKAAEDKQA